MDIKELGEVIEKKIGEIRNDVTTLKSQVESSEKNMKDIFKLDETKAAIKDQIDELMTVKSGEKSTKISDFVAEMQKQLNTIEESIKEQGSLGKNKVKSASQQIADYLATDEFKNAISMKRNGVKMPSEIGFDVKAIATTDIDAIGTDSIPFSLTRGLEPGVAMAPNNPTLFYNLVQKGSVSGKYVAWVERNTVTRNAAAVSENGLIQTSAMDWVEKNVKVEKIGDSVDITNEMLEDADYARSEIMELLQYNVPNIRDTYILGGNGTSPQFWGLNHYAKTFAVPTGIEAIQSPDNYDVLVVAILQCMQGNNAADSSNIGFAPNAIVLNPIDFTNMQLLRDAENKFKYPELMAANPSIMGVPIRLTNRVTVGTFKVGDFTKAKYFAARGMQVRMWDQNGSNPLYDRVTFTATERGVLRVKGPEAFAFVDGTFSTAKTAIINIA